MFKGLTTHQVEENKQKYGANIIIEAEPDTLWDKVKEQLGDPMIKLLLGIAVIMGILSLMHYAEWLEIAGIVFSVALVVFISARTELASDSKYRELKASVKKDVCKVYRNGNIIEVIVDDVVVEDLILLQSGDKVPADGFLIDGFLKVDNSSLNGESEECKKKAHAKGQEVALEDFTQAITGDTFVDHHSLFKGSVVVDGSGVMKVVRVGMETVMGQMATDMADDSVESPLKVKLTDLAHRISQFGYVGSVVIFFAFMMTKISEYGGFEAFYNQGFPIMIKETLEVVMLAVVIVVMAVPEGLPLMIAIVLMQNTSKLLANNVLVRKPVGIETAGSLNILFSDKTGTITKGELEVVEFFDATLADSYKNNASVSEMIKYCISKNTAAMFDEAGHIIGGNFTDKALVSFVTKDVMTNQRDLKVLNHQEFNSANKYSAAEVEGVGTVYKGAPERLLEKAKFYLDDSGAVCELTEEMLTAINNKIDELATKSMRVLSFGYSNKALVENELNDDFILVGFVGIRDDIRPEVRVAIKEVQQAGVQVVMITGDRKQTAVAIAKDSGLIQSDSHIALTSEELNKLTDEEVKRILPNIRVISRALPTDKSRMVRLSQELNLVCGMTGDGVNDAPALKRADVGFAMGSGTDVSKEVAEIVIIDDNFKSIVNAILYGRTIYNNIQKFIKFQLTINVAAVLVCTIAPFLGMEQPLQVTHILWINLIMDGLGALALGSEPALQKYMEEKPKSRTENIVSRSMFGQLVVAGICITGMSLIFLLHPFFKTIFTTNELLLTGYFSFFVLTAVFNGFNIRSEGYNLLIHMKENPGFIKIMGVIILVQMGLTVVGGELFKCTPLNVTQWLVVMAMAVLIIPIDLLRKVIVATFVPKKSVVSELEISPVMDAETEKVLKKIVEFS